MIYVGIDPGITGAVAGISETGKFLFVFDMPTVEKRTASKNRTTAKVKRKIDAFELHKLLWQHLDLCKKEDVTIAIEEQKVMHPKKIPGKENRTMGPTSLMSLGHTYGSIEAVVQVAEIDYSITPSKKWKSYFKIPGEQNGGKKIALSLARMMFRAAPLKLQKHHNRADALLIARYLLESCNE